MAQLPIDAAVLFTEQIPLALVKFPEQARQVDAIYCFKISGQGGGVWRVDLTTSPPSCYSAEWDDAQARYNLPTNKMCLIEMAHEDFKSMLRNPQSGMQLYFQGKLKFTGSATHATKLQQFFHLAGQAAALAPMESNIDSPPLEEIPRVLTIPNVTDRDAPAL